MKFSEDKIVLKWEDVDAAAKTEWTMTPLNKLEVGKGVGIHACGFKSPLCKTEIENEGPLVAEC